MADSVRFNQPAAAVASAARTTTGQSGADGNADGAAFLAVAVNVTAASGTTPNMVIGVQWSMDGVNFYAGDPADAMTAITTTGLVAKQFIRKGPFHRFVWTITGTTPSFTFDIKSWLFG